MFLRMSAGTMPSRNFFSRAISLGEDCAAYPAICGESAVICWPTLFTGKSNRAAMSAEQKRARSPIMNFSLGFDLVAGDPRSKIRALTRRPVGCDPPGRPTLYTRPRESARRGRAFASLTGQEIQTPKVPHPLLRTRARFPSERLFCSRGWGTLGVCISCPVKDAKARPLLADSRGRVYSVGRPGGSQPTGLRVNARILLRGSPATRSNPKEKLMIGFRAFFCSALIAALLLLPVNSVGQQMTADSPQMAGYAAQSSPSEIALEKKFRDGIVPADIRKNMRRLSARPHHVGSPYDKDNAE